MILQRISRALRNQQWISVVLELFIVVVGIFLGLQVNDWNENRKLRQTESLYLEKLSADLIAMEENLQDKISASDHVRARMTAALVGLEACDESESSKADLDYALQKYQVV